MLQFQQLQNSLQVPTVLKQAANIVKFIISDEPGLRLSRSVPSEDGEVIFCKNNVCAHPRNGFQESPTVHVPGYLTIRSQAHEILGTTLILTWVPNSHLEKNPRSLETVGVSPSRSTQEFPIASSEQVAAPENGDAVHDNGDLSEAESGDTSGPDSEPPTPSSPLKLSHFQFDVTTKSEEDCGVFSVDLGQMRSVRLFHADDQSGELVVTSREGQYKLLHFHHSGLDRLAEALRRQWPLLGQSEDLHDQACVTLQSAPSEHERCQLFHIRRPPPNAEFEPHPEESAHEPVGLDTWHYHVTAEGRISDSYQLRKSVFFAGLASNVRHEAWPFLLQYFPYSSTLDERELIRNQRFLEYQEIRRRRESLRGDELAQFERDVVVTVDKDVVRTDRSHPYFRGEGNPNLTVLRSILLNYALTHPRHGYSQGMSDLLAPLLIELRSEADTFWCFQGLMQKTIFVSAPRDDDMELQLSYLRELFRLMLPRFYETIMQDDDSWELLFCHRWILLCFKREFPEPDVCRIWEACWSRYQTEYFHLFVCVAIVQIYGQLDLATDEALLHFGSLAMRMDGQIVLRKARSLLHQFRQLAVIPCSLVGLCERVDPGMWDSGVTQSVKCTGRHGGPCPNSTVH